VDKRISTIYAKLILGRSFTTRKELNNCSYEYTRLNFRSFIPFSSAYKSIKSMVKDSDRVYIKFELLELLILLYFGGYKVLKKTIGGLRTAYIYPVEVTYMDKLHNKIYGSKLIGKVLSRLYKIHALNNRDADFIKNKFVTNNLEVLGNSLTATDLSSNTTPHSQLLEIIFVGELSIRKGVDIVLEVIKNAPQDFNFVIIGDGNLEKEVQRIAEQKQNVKYMGHVENKVRLNNLYSNADILLFPSRAEGFGNVMLEALNNGLVIVNCYGCALQLPNEYEYTCDYDSHEILRVLKLLHDKKKSQGLDKLAINEYCKSNFDDKVVLNTFYLTFIKETV